LSLDKSQNDWGWIKAKDFMLFNPKESIKKGTVVKNVPMDKIEPKTKEIPSYELTEYKGGVKFRNGDILMARITPCLENGKISQVSILDYNEIGAGSTEFIVLREKEGISDKDFIYYLSNSEYFKEPAIKSMVGSSGRQRVQRDVVENLEIYVPPLETQKKIGKVLSFFDKKISLNKKINKNLEKMLITIFNSWFINFENYDNSKGMKIDDSYGEIPVDWSVEMLEDYVDFVTGVEPGSKNYHEKPEPNDIPFLRVGDLGSRDNGVFIDPSLSKNKILKYDDIVLSLDATIGIVKMGLEGAYSTGMRKLVIKNDNINQPFLYCLVKSNRIQRIIETFATGTTILHAGKSIKHMNFVLSDKKTMDDFGKIGNPIISIILTNLKEIEYLTNLRDTLLPKLMSGEIDVSKINCDLE
jgi:type I restriction enzyme S subunit